MQAPKFEKFIKVMMLTTSPSEGEALNAIRKANSLLAEANLDWDDFLRGKAKITGGSSQVIYSGKKYTNGDEIEMMFNQILSTINKGTSFYKFIISLSEWWEDNSFLTEKQYSALRKSYERI